MSARSGTATSGRLLGLLSVLQTGRDWPAPVLAERLGVSDRTVRRDVERLRELGYAIQTTRGPHGGYRLAAGTRLPPLLLDDEQGLAVAIALRSVGSLGLGIEDAADRALQNLLRLLPERLAHRAAAITVTPTRPSRSAEIDPATVLAIGEAIQRTEEVRFDYDIPGRAETPYAPAIRAEPHHLVLRNGTWYLLAYAPDRADWRIYRVDRMSLRAQNGRRFARRSVPGPDAAGYLESRFRGSRDTAATWPCEGQVVLRARAVDVAPYLGEGTLEVLDDDRCRIRLGSWSWIALAAALLLFDRDVAHAEPRALRDAFAVLAQRAASDTVA